jgi:uncharacterized protein YggE
MPIKQDSVKNWFWILLNAVLVVAVLLGFSVMLNLWKQNKALFPARNISVNAEGKQVVVPDIATLSFSVVSEGADPGKIQEDNTKKINAAIDFLKKEGVEAKDIKTTGYNLSPRYEYDERRRRSEIVGYTLVQSVEVKIRDFAKISKILAALPDLGINQINGVNFGVDDPEKFLNLAREEAFSKARAKAEAMAKQNGVRIKRVITFNEYGGGYPIPFFERAVGIGGDFDVPAPLPPVIEPGTQEVTVNVNVVYEIW